MSLRPERQAPPEIFYNDAEARKYTTSSRMIDIQAKLTERAIELLALPDDGVPRLLLDIGCGSGLSGETLSEHGHHWIGMDISESMIEAHTRWSSCCRSSSLDFQTLRCIESVQFHQSSSTCRESRSGRGFRSGREAGRSSRSPADGVFSSQRFSDLVVKCLIKLTKVLGSTITEVDLDRLLQSIHECFQQLGLEEIRKRAGADDKPLRMVKTVLHELVKLRGTAIKGHLSMVPIDSEPPPIILAYIDLNLQTLAASRVLAPTVTGSQGHWLDSGANGPDSSPSSSAETQLKQELAAIFKKIGDKQTSTIGLYELYRITQLYPQVDIFSQLQNASLAFRTYIRDGLAQMEKSAASGRAPVPSSFVSPPPLSTSPGQLQPKASLSNSHSDVNLPTSLPSTGAEVAEVAGGPLPSSESDPSVHRRTAGSQRFTGAVSAQRSPLRL